MALPHLGCNGYRQGWMFCVYVFCSATENSLLRLCSSVLRRPSLLAGDRGLLSNFLLTVLVPFWRQHSATVAQLNWSKLWHVDTYLKKARCGLATRDMCVPSTLTPSVGMALEVQAALVPHHAQAVSAACARCGRLVALRALALAALLRPGQGVTS